MTLAGHAVAMVLTAGLTLLPLSVAGAQASLPGPLTLTLNLPSYWLETREGNRVTHRFRVAIGDTAFQTPTGRFEVTRVEWDPWWIPPPSEWAAGDSITPPGDRNPMGRVKLYWKDLYFLHGTPHGASVGSAVSHGCVRLRNGDAIALAKLVQRYASPGVGESALDAWADSPGKTQVVLLDRAVPLEITYEPAIVRRDTLIVYPDVYHRFADGLAGRALEAIARAGYDTARVDRAKLEARLRSAGRRVAVVPVVRLLRTR